MKLFTALQLLALIITSTGVQCQDQIVLQPPAQDDAPGALPTCQYHTYAAIGDSYSAGLASWYQLPLCNGSNGPNCTSATCARNMGSYGYQFASRLRINDFRYLACSGANTSQIIANQVPQIYRQTSLVTLTAGGDNENIFEKLVENCVYSLSGSNCSATITNATNIINNLDLPMTTLWRSIRTQAPGAVIVHLGYVHFWPSNYNYSEPNACQDLPLWVTPGIQEAMNSLIHKFNNKMASLASSNGVYFVNVNPYFETHRFCDLFETYILWRLRFSRKYYGGVFHPDQIGQDFYRKGLEGVLNCTSGTGVTSGDL